MSRLVFSDFQILDGHREYWGLSNDLLSCGFSLISRGILQIMQSLKSLLVLGFGVDRFFRYLKKIGHVIIGH